MNKKNILKSFLFILPMGLIGTGAFMIYPPAGFISLGILIWIELFSLGPVQSKDKD